MSETYKITVKEVRETTKTIEVDKSLYLNLNSAERNIVEFLDNYTFDELLGNDDVETEISINSKSIEDIEAGF